MARKKTSMRGNSLFQNIQDLSVQAEQPSGGGVPSETYALIEIMPDPDQPRVLLPNRLREALFSGRLKPQEVLQIWMKETGKLPTAVLEDEGGSLQHVIDLAESIKAYGLINPITVRPAPPELKLPIHVKHLIVTGERRYWAHVYLSSQNEMIQETQDPNFIRAGQTASGSPIRILQWIENIQREDINVVEKARGLELIKEELKSVTGKPEITWPEVQKVAQIGKSQRIRIMNALKLDERVIDLITQHGLTERAIRPITEKLRGKPELQVKALDHLLVLRDADDELYGSLPTLGQFVDQLLNETSKPAGSNTSSPATLKERDTGLSQIHKKLANTNNYLSQIVQDGRLKALSKTQKASLHTDLQAMQNRIAELLKKLK